MSKTYSTKEIKEILTEKIRNGDYKPNDRLPTERELMEIYKVSRTTIRNVIGQLISNRSVYRVPDVGVFVEKEIIRKSNRVMGFTEMIKESGRIPKTTVINFELQIPQAHILTAMGLKENTSVYLMERCRSVDGQPILYEYVYICPSKAPGLDKYNFSNNSLYEILKDKYNIEVHYLKENVSAVTVDSKISDFLYKTSTAYALKVEGLTYDRSDEVIEYGISYYHAEKFSFESILVNRS